MSEVVSALEASPFSLGKFQKGNRMMMAVAYRATHPIIHDFVTQLCSDSDAAGRREIKKIVAFTYSDLWLNRERNGRLMANMAFALRGEARNLSLWFSKSDRKISKKERPYKTIGEICKPLYKTAERVLPDDQKALFVASYKDFKPDTQIAKEFGLTIDEIHARQSAVVETMNTAWTAKYN